MLFFVNETYHFAVRIKDPEEALQIADSFASGHKICVAENETELVYRMFEYMRFKKGDRMYQYTLNDNENKPLFIHLFDNSPLSCGKLKEYFNSGIIKEIAKPVNIKIMKQMSFPSAKAVEKKFLTVPFSMRNHIAGFGVEVPTEPDKVIQKIGEETPANKTILKEEEFKEIILEKANFDSSYLNDNIFNDAIVGAQMLYDNYQKAVSQKPELLAFVKNCDKETLDILHDLELEYKWYDVITAYKTILKITHIRRQRRKAKDKIEVINALEEGLALECAKGIADLPNKLQNRQYRKRNNSGMFDYEKVFKKKKGE